MSSSKTKASNSTKGDDSKKSSSKLSRAEVLHLANLVQLHLSDAEIESLQSQLAQTIDYIRNLNELDTKNVKETAHATDAKNVTFEDGAEPDRTFSQEDATKNAQNSRNGYFIVSKILDK